MPPIDQQTRTRLGGLQGLGLPIKIGIVGTHQYLPGTEAMLTCMELDAADNSWAAGFANLLTLTHNSIRANEQKPAA